MLSPGITNEMLLWIGFLVTECNMLQHDQGFSIHTIFFQIILLFHKYLPSNSKCKQGIHINRNRRCSVISYCTFHRLKVMVQYH